jgi:hypothetical protein
MSKIKNINPINFYNLDTIDYNNILSIDDYIYNFFWNPNPLLLNKLYNKLDNMNINTNIIDIGCSNKNKQFKKATHLLDFNYYPETDKILIKFDLDFDKFQYDDNHFNYIYCRHTLEDLQNPQNAFAEIVRISKSGFIETPSPLVEVTKDIDGWLNNLNGYIHHRYIVWTDMVTNTLKFLPKYPLIQHFKYVDDILEKRYNYLLNNYCVYWNNYYIWDEYNKPNILVYRNDINMNIMNDYDRLLNEAISSSIDYTTYYINMINNQ